MPQSCVQPLSFLRLGWVWPWVRGVGGHVHFRDRNWQCVTPQRSEMWPAAVSVRRLAALRFHLKEVILEGDGVTLTHHRERLGAPAWLMGESSRQRATIIRW